MKLPFIAKMSFGAFPTTPPHGLVSTNPSHKETTSNSFFTCGSRTFRATSVSLFGTVDVELEGCVIVRFLGFHMSPCLGPGTA